MRRWHGVEIRGRKGNGEWTGSLHLCRPACTSLGGLKCSLDRLHRAVVAGASTLSQSFRTYSVFPWFVFGARLAGHLNGLGASNFSSLRTSLLSADPPCGASVSSRRCPSRITMPLSSHRFLACSHMPPGSRPISPL